MLANALADSDRPLEYQMESIPSYIWSGVFGVQHFVMILHCRKVWGLLGYHPSYEKPGFEGQLTTGLPICGRLPRTRPCRQLILCNNDIGVEAAGMLKQFGGCHPTMLCVAASMGIFATPMLEKKAQELAKIWQLGTSWRSFMVFWACSKHRLLASKKHKATFQLEAHFSAFLSFSLLRSFFRFSQCYPFGCRGTQLNLQWKRRRRYGTLWDKEN